MHIKKKKKKKKKSEYFFNLFKFMCCEISCHKRPFTPHPTPVPSLRAGWGQWVLGGTLTALTDSPALVHKAMEDGVVTSVSCDGWRGGDDSDNDDNTLPIWWWMALHLWWHIDSHAHRKCWEILPLLFLSFLSPPFTLIYCMHNSLTSNVLKWFLLFNRQS